MRTLRLLAAAMLFIGLCRSASAADQACARPCPAGSVCGPSGQCVAAACACPPGYACDPYGRCVWWGYPQVYAAPAPPPPAPAENKNAPRRFHVGPLAGVHSYRGNISRFFSPGLRVGALADFALGPSISIDAELTTDFANPQNLAQRESFSRVTVLSAVGPRFHLPIGAGDLVSLFGGPVAGLGIDWLSDQVGGAGSLDYTAQAWLVGARAGFLFRAGQRLSIGAELSFDYWQNFSYFACVTVNGSCTTYADALKVVALAGTVLF